MKRLILIVFILNLFFVPGRAQTGLVWTQDMTVSLPSSVRLFSTSTPFDGNFRAYYLEIDLSDKSIQIRTTYDPNLKTPKDFAESQTQQVYAAINGGYFTQGASYSLIIGDGILNAKNITALTRQYFGDGTNKTYYPTRSAFGIDASGQPTIDWVYNITGGFHTYSYPQPAPNSQSNLPLPQPTADFPTGGTPWDMKVGMGGGPILIKNSVKITNYDPELFQTDITSTKAPRTAVGITADNKIIFLVVDGRQSFAAGITLSNLALVMEELGCTDAINMDGGGSSGMWADGKVINSPSDGTMRRVAGALLVTQGPRYIDTEDDGYGESASLVEYQGNANYGNSLSRILPLTSVQGPVDSVHYSMGNILPGKYDVSLWVQKDMALTSSARIRVDREGDVLSEELSVDLTKLSDSGFLGLGQFELSDKDTLVMYANGDDGKVILVDALQLNMTGTYGYNTSFEGGKSAGLYATGEAIAMKGLVQSVNSGIFFTKLDVYRKRGGLSPVLLETVDFEDAYSHSHAINFEVTATSGQELAIFEWTDNKGNKAILNFTVTVQNNTPTISFPDKGKSLFFNFGTTYEQTLRLTAPSLTRRLSKLEISEIENGIETITQTIELPSEPGIQDFPLQYNLIRDASFYTLKFTVFDQLNFNSSGQVLMNISNLPVSTNEDLQNRLSVFPNPTAGYLNIEVAGDVPSYYRLVNLMGQELAIYEGLSVNSGINLEGLPDGIYILEAHYKGYSNRTRIVKK